jgi:hypothetical protein
MGSILVGSSIDLKYLARVEVSGRFKKRSSLFCYNRKKCFIFQAQGERNPTKQKTGQSFAPQFTSSPETSLLVCRQLNSLISYTIESFVSFHINNNRDDRDEIYISLNLDKKNYSFLYLLVCSAKSRIVPFYPPQFTSSPETSLLVCRQLNNLISYTIESFVTLPINNNRDVRD